MDEMEKKKAKEGGIEYTIIISDIPNTLDPKKFIPTMMLPRNAARSELGLSETILKSVYLSETNEVTVSPFTQGESRKRWGRVYWYIFGYNPEKMHRAASTLVAWASRLTRGHNTIRMGIDDTGLGDWNLR